MFTSLVESYVGQQHGGARPIHRSASRREVVEFSLMLIGAALKEFVLRARYSIDADQLTRELIDVVTRYVKIRR
jgi:hypothetical protein